MWDRAVWCEPPLPPTPRATPGAAALCAPGEPAGRAMPSSVPRFRSLVAAQLVLPRTSPSAAQPAWHVHRLEDGVHEHVVVCSEVLSVRTLLIIQVLLPRRLRRLGRRFLLWRCGRRALLPEPHPSCPFRASRRVRLSLTASWLARVRLPRLLWRGRTGASALGPGLPLSPAGATQCRRCASVALRDLQERRRRSGEGPDRRRDESNDRSAAGSTAWRRL
jgi:hypothetical protein